MASPPAASLIRPSAIPGSTSLSRRALLGAGLSSLAFGGPAAAAVPQISVGAIRWDAWYVKQDNSVFAQDALAPARYQGRAPVHCVAGDDTLVCTGDQAVLDAEILAAARGGLAFWAFDWFAPGTSFRRAWELYQSSSLKYLIDWCPIVSLGDLGSASGSVTEMATKAAGWVTLMGGPSFFKVPSPEGPRPLMFVFYRPAEMTSYFGTLAAMKAGLDRLRAAARAGGVGDPYIVLFDVMLDTTLFAASGADALGNYNALFAARPQGTYADLDRQVRQYWDRMAATAVPVVPIVQVGWDTRAAQDHPMPWDQVPPRRPGDPVDYYALATPAEFAAEVTAAASFVRQHPQACATQVVLVYSWDECEEGGGIMPTRGDPEGSYLSALAEALKPVR